MVTIKEVEEVLSRTILPAPKHVFISEKPVKVEGHNRSFFVIGFQKKGMDMIVLTPQSDVENIIHETIHSLGFGEILAQIGGKLGSIRLQLFPNLFRKKVKYRMVDEDVAEKVGLIPKEEYYVLESPAERRLQVKHFVLEMV